MTVEVDRNTCIGCTLCASIDPEVYQMDDENIATVVHQPEEAQTSEAVEAAESCPVDAINVYS